MIISEKRIRQWKRDRRKFGGPQYADEVSGKLTVAAHRAFLILQQLHQADAFRGTGLTVDIDIFGSAIVHCRGTYRGAWHWDGRAYSWIPSGYAQPELRVPTPEDAAYRTLCLVHKTMTRAGQCGALPVQIDAALGVTDAADNDNANSMCMPEMAERS